MNDHSDPGYDYLGTTLASRGVILVSVDENYLNTGLAADLLGFRRMQGTDVTRGWLLLEHLRQWRTWSLSPGNPFYGVVDMDRVALMGHSLGGQAAATAAALNGLSHYPDDATIMFDYNFGIRSVVAIAPADRQYMPAGHETPLRDVSYLTLHGSLDMDAVSFMGAWQYQRVEFSEGNPGFKASVYIHGANHGQFNSTWRRADNNGLGFRRYNLEQIMPEDAQQRIAKVYISAFLATTLQERREYLPMFRDHRKAARWLPDTLYITRFQDARTELICTWEEDIDVTTTTLPGGSISGENLTLWFEEQVWMWTQDDSEPILQTYEIPFAAFLEANPSLRPEELASVRLVFDQIPQGTILLDDLGFQTGD